jgi:hypothetical protein
MDYLNKPDPDFDQQLSDPADYQDNYEYRMNCIMRKTVFAHALRCLRELRATMKGIEDKRTTAAAPQNLQVVAKDVPNICYADEAIKVSKEGVFTLREVLSESNN